MTNSLVKEFTIGRIYADVGSDWHLKLTDENIVGRAVDHLRDNRRSDIFFCMGDIFDTAWRGFFRSN